MVKISAHFTNALKRERERLYRHHDTVSAKISKLADEQHEIDGQIEKINEQLAEPEETNIVVTLPPNQHMSADDMAVAKAV